MIAKLRARGSIWISLGSLIAAFSLTGCKPTIQGLALVTTSPSPTSTEDADTTDEADPTPTSSPSPTPTPTPRAAVTISLASSTPATAYGESSALTVAASLSGGTSFRSGDVVTLYRGGNSTCNGTQVDQENVAADGASVALADTLSTYGSNSYYVKIVGADGLTVCSSAAHTHHYLRTLTVSAQYTYGAKWNDWTKADDSAACVGNEANLSSCVHGGDKRLVLTSYDSCAGLTMTDQLGAFDWTCAVSGGYARFTSALKSTKRLGDLVSTTAWTNNKVTLSGGLVSQESTAAAWWTNAVTPLPTDNLVAGPIVLGTASTIYVLGATTNSAGFSIEADKIAVVVKSGAQLIGNRHSYFDAGTGEAAVSGNTAILGSGSQKFLWIEGAYTGTPTVTDMGIIIAYSSFTHIRKVDISQIQGRQGNAGTGGVWSEVDSDADTIMDTCSETTPPVNGTDGAQAIGLVIRDVSKSYIRDISITSVRGGIGGAADAPNLYTCMPNATTYWPTPATAGNAGGAVGAHFYLVSKSSISNISVSTLQAGVGGAEAFNTDAGNTVCSSSSMGFAATVMGVGIYTSTNNTFDGITVSTLDGDNGNLNGQVSGYSGAPSTGMEVHSTSTGNTFSNLTFTGITGATASGGIEYNCGGMAYTGGAGYGANATGVSIDSTSTSNTFQTVSISNVTAGSVTSSRNVSGTQNISSGTGGEAMGLALWANNTSFTDLTVSSIHSGTGEGGYDFGNAGAFAVNGPNAYGVLITNASTGVTFDDVTINSVLAEEGTDTPQVGGNGGHAYGFFGTNATFNIGTASLNGVRGGMGGDGNGTVGGSGGDAYGIGGRATSTWNINSAVLTTSFIIEGTGGGGSSLGSNGNAADIEP